MKLNIKTVLSVILAGLFGLLIGYFIFKSDAQSAENHNHAAVESTENKATEETTYICSMHPQIRQNEPGECPICGMDLIPAGENSSTDPTVLEMTEAAVKLANIQTTIVGGAVSSGEGGNVIRLSGKVKADERRASSQSAHVPGRIEKLFVTFTGEKIGKDQRLATIYSPDLITAQRELLESLKLLDLNPNLAKAARNKLRFWKIGEPTIAEIEQSGKVRETFDLFADASGIISNRRVSVGDYVKQGESLFDLMNLNKVWVLFDVYEKDLANIRVGDRIEFATASDPNKVFKTKITFIDPLLNPATRAATVRAEVSNSNGFLKPEMFVTGTLKKKPSSGKKSQLTVPKTAVLWTGKRSVVYVKLPDTEIPSFKFREIEIGETLGDNYLIVSGLESGEEVVTYGSFTIDAAAQLNNQASMMNRNIKVKDQSSIVILPDYTATTPLEFKVQLADASAAYLLLKDALVATDSEQAINASKKVNDELSSVDMSLVKSDAHLYWMQQLEAIQGHNEKINSSKDIEAQRKQFDFLSQALINVVKVFGVPDDTLYVQHCPMANNNEGADWLSSEEEIRNPYFGDKMLNCGLVKTTIDKNFKN